ncbi:hypothetical protein Poli38472_008629 [Pythium oligandrum]|uniref:NADH:ubiquinone oxidoreductase intermediate-associated protein 30 domain-containing protein n=1 Tax=Pythium oligandrum TaxID=41045 RepID=A0A8K1FBC9_PYTOL|nr:hypothetical protein Poli38472_008629 [Pythium oligandrum]|eukprot:TMW55981.1 hypothetical protein Poli38472_008629 [Pythium oligandrum]
MSFLRRALVSVEAAILSSKQSMGMKLNIPTEKDIFLFNSRAATKGWVASSDRSIGGLSECRWEYYDPKETRDESAPSALKIREDDEAAAVFSGRVSLACQPTEAGIVRSGYCAVRGVLPRDMLLHGYEGITMRIMTDGREYRLNAQMVGWNPLNLYIGFIRTPPNQWVDIELPFRDFLLTAKGYYKFDDSTPLDPANLRSIGIAIADQKEGDFELRVQWIKAIAKVDSREVRDEDIPDIDGNSSKRDRFRKADDVAI